MAWSVDIGAIPPPAPGWDTGWGEESEIETDRTGDEEVRYEKLQHLLGDIKFCSNDQHLLVNFYECEKCGKIFKHAKSVKRHKIKTPSCDRKEYSKLFQCCLCNKMLGNRQKLAAHHRTHTREKPFQCNLCEKMFAECSSLRKHLLTHGPRKYKCDYCNKCFVRKDYLYKHVKSNVCRRFIE